jgi:hypothetical protein
MTVAQALKVLFDADLMIPCYDFFTEPYEPLVQRKLEWEPSEEGLLITFCDGSKARYDDGDYFVL